jgi:hypothetical protein
MSQLKKWAQPKMSVKIIKDRQHRFLWFWPRFFDGPLA